MKTRHKNFQSEAPRRRSFSPQNSNFHNSTIKTEPAAEWIRDSHSLRSFAPSRSHTWPRQRSFLWKCQNNFKCYRGDRGNYSACSWADHRKCDFDNCNRPEHCGYGNIGTIWAWSEEYNLFYLFKRVELLPDLEQIKITLSKIIPRGDDYVLEINFYGSMVGKIVGLYRSTYKDPDGNDRWVKSIIEVHFSHGATNFSLWHL